MPTVSEAQRRAMWAAAEGHSTLGIPRSVGKEFVAKDDKEDFATVDIPLLIRLMEFAREDAKDDEALHVVAENAVKASGRLGMKDYAKLVSQKGATASDGAEIAAGIVFVAPDGDVLLLRRAADEPNYGGFWGLPGGKAEDGEDAVTCARRETLEEIGVDPGPDGLRIIDKVLTPNGMIFTTFSKPSASKFTPVLDGEHSGWCWASLDMLPQPLHPSVARTLGENIGAAMDMQPAEWTKLRETFAKWTREEEAEPEHADDANGAFSEKDKAAASSKVKHREDMPESAFLLPGERKYPVKEKTDGEWSYDRDLLLGAAREARMHGHEDIAARADAIRKREFGAAKVAEDAAILAMDKGTYDARGKRIRTDDILAMDLSPSVRTYDKDGQLHIARTPISKAMVSEYYGREIPNAAQLGLEPNTKYRLLRDPDELKKAAASSNGKQLMFSHVPVSADDTQKDEWVGAIGTDAEFVDPYLYNSLHVHDRLGIDGIESGEQKQISSSYRYRPDMTPGNFRGEPYDGVMRDIDFNHVCLVSDGRCGDDVFVHDEKPKETKMPKTVLSRKAAVLKGAVSAYLMPKLAMDAKGGIPAIDLTPVLKDITSGNFKARRGQLITGIKACTAGKLAMDAKLDDLPAFLGAFDAEEPDEDDKDKKADDKDEDEDEDDKKAKDEEERKKAAKDEFLKGKLSAEDKAAYDALDDDKDDNAAEKKAMSKDKAKDEDPKMKPETVTKPAMDAAIAQTEKRVAARFRAIREAEKAVAPYVGDLGMAFDSADEVYRHALEANDVDTKGIDPSAFPAMLKLVTPPGSKPKAPDFAMDAAASDSFHTMYPDASRLSNA